MNQSDFLSYKPAKWQVTEILVFKLVYHYGITEDWDHPRGWYSIVERDDGCYLIVYGGCAWDGATLYPDYAWMIVPSLVHDVLLYLVARGVIDERYNDVIDSELYWAIIDGKEPIPLLQGGNSKFVRKLRAKIVLRGVNTADTKNQSKTEDIKHRRVVV